MPKKQGGKRHRHAKPTLRPRRLLSAVCLLLAVAIIGVTFAQWRATPAVPATPLMTAAIVTVSPTPLALAKEYVYAGGRLIATEEPTPAPTPTPWPSCTPPTGVIISEFRLRGANGTDSARDEFVELFNTNSTPVTVCTADGSGGWAVAASDGAIRFVVPYGTTIPAWGHYLGTNSSYSLSSYGGGASGDVTYTTDIADNAGVALFNTANAASFNTVTRLDAAGFTSEANSLYREGTGLAPIGTAAGEYSFTRKLNTGLPQDTNNNAADFAFVSTTAGSFGGSVASALGAPGPENLLAPIQRNATIKASLIDTMQASSSPPNRVRDTTANVCGNSNICALGTLTIRRKFTNQTGQMVTRLRFRVVDVTTLNNRQPSQADLRALDSVDVTVTLTNGSQVLVTGTTVEQPPTQGLGGGLNTTVTVNLGGALAPNASVNVQFVLGVQASGGFSFFVNTEALP